MKDLYRFCIFLAMPRSLHDVLLNASLICFCLIRVTEASSSPGIAYQFIENVVQIIVR